MDILDSQEVDLKGWGSHVRMLTIAAGVMGIIQGATYTALTITGLVSYLNCTEIPDLDTFGGYLQSTYFRKSCDPTTPETLTKSDYYIGSDDLHVWICIVLSFSILWIIASCLMVFGVKDKLTKLSAYFIIAWSSVTIIICVIDLALGILLGIDLGSIKIPDPNPNPFNERIELDSNMIMIARFVVGFMMTMAFKGFILWILNFAFSTVLISTAVQILNPEEEDELNKDYPSHNNMARSPINAYESPSTLPRPTTWLQDSQNMDRPRLQNQQSLGYGRSFSQYSQSPGEINHGYMGMEPPKFQQQQPLASIMKKSVADRNNEQINKPRPRNEPNVPDPDYSPVPMRGRPPYNQQMSQNSQYYNSPYRRGM